MKAAELYSRFKPMNKEPDWISLRRPHPAGDIPGSRTYMTPESVAATAAKLSDRNNAVTRTVTVDSHELFSQLFTVGYLGKREPLRGLLGSIQEVCDGTIRVWRDWLSKQCQSKKWTDGEPIAIQRDESGEVSSGSLSTETNLRKDSSILWVNNTKGDQVGLKMGVKEKKWQRETPVLFASDIEVPVSYLVEIEGEPTPACRLSAQLTVPYRGRGVDYVLTSENGASERAKPQPERQSNNFWKLHRPGSVVLPSGIAEDMNCFVTRYKDMHIRGLSGLISFCRCSTQMQAIDPRGSLFRTDFYYSAMFFPQSYRKTSSNSFHQPFESVLPLLPSTRLCCMPRGHD